MVLYLFGSKEGLFRAAMQLIIDPQRLVEAITDGDDAELGTRLVRAYLAIWDDPDTGASMAAAVSGALGGGPETRMGAVLAAGNLIAPAVQRYLTADADELGLPDGYRP